MDVMEAIRKRRSVRAYQGKPIPQGLLDELTEALRLAPSACNYQPWHFIIVTDPAQRQAVSQACRGQAFIAEAPVVIVGCGLVDESYARMGGYWSSCEIDVAVALDHLTLAAVEAGLGTCWIGAFSENEVKRVLGIPKNVKPVGLITLGYPASETASPGRKPRDQVFSLNKY